MTIYELVDKAYEAFRHEDFDTLVRLNSYAGKFGYELMVQKPESRLFVMVVRHITPVSIHHDEL